MRKRTQRLASELASKLASFPASLPPLREIFHEVLSHPRVRNNNASFLKTPEGQITSPVNVTHHVQMSQAMARKKQLSSIGLLIKMILNDSPHGHGRTNDINGAL